jgi:ATP-dependent Clp protease adapter protein ClpS
MLQLLNVNQAQKDAEDPFWQVMLHDDTEHTLEYAIEALERSLLSIKSAENDKENLEESEKPNASVMRTRRRLQWTAFQTHHYGMGIVSVLPRHDAESLVSQLSREGLRSSMVPF